MGSLSISSSTLVQGAFLASRCLHVPFWTLLTLLTLILYKTCAISPWHVLLLIAIKPVSGTLAPYWSQAIHKRPDKLVQNLLYAQLLRYTPFVLLFWTDSPFLILLSYGLSMTMQRASVPAWMELLKRYLNEKQRREAVSYACMIDHVGVALFSIPLGWLLDAHEPWWREIIALSACLGLLSICLIWTLQPLTTFLASLESNEQASVESFKKDCRTLWKQLPKTLSRLVLQPWKESLSLLYQEKEFASYVFGVMLGGAGLMIVQPALPSFFIDTLHLSFTEMGCAIALCRGVGSLTSPWWSRAMQKIDFLFLSAIVTAFAMLWPLFMLAAKWEVTALYIAYFLYGVMQAGSEMSWHLSGVIYAKERESSAFSTTNVLMVGLRGVFVPALGTYLLSVYGAGPLLWIGMSLSCMATLYFVCQGLKIKIRMIRTLRTPRTPLN